MANTYSQVYIQFVFSVQNRESIIKKDWQDRLYKYIIAIIQNYKHKVLAIGGLPDHIHIFIGMQPTQTMSDLVQNVKRDSSKWINENHLTMGRFSWQEGYGVFSYSRSHIDNVVKYILNQEEKHKNKTFIEEYKSFLDSFGVEYDPKYIFKEVKY